MADTAPIYRFGIFELDLRRRELRRDGVKVPLQEQPLQLLEALLQRQGGLVGRDELRALLWEADVHVDFTAGINSAVRRLREALGDDADSPRFVQTLPRRGYRFLAPFERVAPPGVPEARETTETPGPPETATTPETPAAGRPVTRLGWSAAGWLLAGLLATLLVVVLVRYLPRSEPLVARGMPPADTLTRPPPPGSIDEPDSTVRAHFERARHFADRRSREGLEKAIAEYQSGLALAPESDALRAEGYSGLAVSYVTLGFYDYWRPADAFGPARTMATRALTIDPSSAAANLAMSLVLAVSDWDWAASEAALDRALAADPGLAETHLWRAILLSNLGRHDEAIAEIDRALRTEPVSSVLNTARGWLLFMARRDDEAIEQSRRTLELAPSYYDAWDNLKWIHITRGEYSEAARAWAKATELGSNGGDGDGLLAAYQQHGLPYLLRKSLQGKLERQRKGYSSPYDMVLDYAALGEIGPALDQLERSHAEHETDLLALAVDPRLDALRGEDRFKTLLAALGLP